MLIRRKSIEADGNRAEGPGRVPSAARSSVRSKPRYAPVTFSELDGVRFLHFGTEWIQGAMRLRKPDWLELEYAQQMMAWMLFLRKPRHIVQLGLGSAALTKFSYRQFPDAQVTAVELNPDVISACRAMFKLPPDDERLAVLEADAMDVVASGTWRGTVDALQVDLYDASARGPVLDTPEFYRACASTLSPNGIMTVNLFGDHPSYRRNLDAMAAAFPAIVPLPEVHEGNVVAVAFKSPPLFEFQRLYERAAEIQAQTRLPAASWVNGLKAGLEALRRQSGG